VRELEMMGVKFVDDLVEIPRNSIVVFSAHGVSEDVEMQARERGLPVIDATCPLVAKVHVEAQRYEKDGDEVIGNETRVKVLKNKVAPPFRQAEFQILYGKGIFREGEIIEIGVEQGILEKSGAWYSYNGDRIGQGRKNAAEWLAENVDARREIEQRITEQLLPQKTKINVESEQRDVADGAIDDNDELAGIKNVG